MRVKNKEADYLANIEVNKHIFGLKLAGKFNT